MDQEALTSLKSWFARYCTSFTTPVQEDQRNIAVKEYHTHQVCLNTLQIARDLDLSDRETMLAEAIALFHDIGRFPQYQQYKTFDDSISVNHAVLGAKVLLEKDALQGLAKRERDLIIHAVTLHNVFSLPAELDESTRLFATLVRDADKLDILRVFIEYYEQDEASRADAVALGLPDEPRYSPKILTSLAKGEMVEKSNLTTLNDFKLLQLSWLYDINFAGSLRTILERGYLDKLVSLLPATDEIRIATDSVRTYVSDRLTHR